MNNRKCIVGLAAFFACLWLVAVTTYASQIKSIEGGMMPIQLSDSPTSCSSSSGGGKE